MKKLKNILLIIIGILLSLVILEIGLQTVSYVNKIVKNYQINRQIKNKDSITILCLGEYTTDGTWPPILQQILNKKSNKRFNIIDAGKYGCNTNDILEKVSNIIIDNKIDVIISMMGINDYDINTIKIRHYKLKIVKLYYLLKKHLIVNLLADDINKTETSLKKCRVLLNSKKNSEALAILKNLNDINLSGKQIIDKYYIFINILLSLNNGHINSNNYTEIKKYINIINSIKNNSMLDIYIKLLIYEKNIDGLEELFSNDNLKKYLQSYFDPIMCSLKDLENLGLNNIIERINLAIYNSIDNKNLDTKIRSIGYIALNSFIKQEHRKANNLFYSQTNLLIQNINKQTAINYIKLSKICNHNNIKLIAMQYPVRSIKPLQEMLKNQNNITFISNENNFKQALQRYKLEDIFVDRFAGDFGHCTDLGNTLIAENVAETILKLYN